MDIEVVINRPVLTLPEREAELLRETYAGANTILEYGMGGSTVLAAEQVGKTVFSVENSASWFHMMQEYFEANPPSAAIHLHLVDVGEVKKWGHPKNHSGWHSYQKYPLSIWDLQEFSPPDVVLIDGRFRVGCFLATLFRCEKPTVVLFDDYTNRKKYHIVEKFAKVESTSGRMARFEITPQAIPAKELELITYYLSETY